MEELMIRMSNVNSDGRGNYIVKLNNHQAVGIKYSRIEKAYREAGLSITSIDRDHDYIILHVINGNLVKDYIKAGRMSDAEVIYNG